MADSIFTRIIKGEVPCNKIYEDQQTMAFLTIEPIQPGHTLVVSKNQIDHIWDLPQEDYQAVMDTAKKVANHMRQILDAKRIGVKIEGLEVPHAHIHLIPFSTISEFNQLPKIATDSDLSKMATKLAF